MKLSSAWPVVALRDYVRRFEQRDAEVGGPAVIYPIAARPDQFLEFYHQDPYMIHFRESGARDLAPRAVVVGPSTYRRVELVLHGRLETFTIHFQPSGFYQLFGVPMPDLTDRAYEARSVLGRCVSGLEQRLANTSNFGERIRVATSFLIRRVMSRSAPPDAVARAANRVLFDRGALRISEVAASAGLSVRQFERRFCEQVGVGPKRYARIVRFHSALEAKRTSEKRTWTDIAYELGYYDQMHMVHDFRIFSGENPTSFSARFTTLPQRWS
jgi:AraC-like DNA-binding protein